MKLMTARVAAGVTLGQRSDTSANSFFGLPATTVTTPRSFFEKRAAAKLSSSPKARKLPIIGWFLAGVIIGIFFVLFAQGVVWFTTGIPWNPWVPWYLIVPLSTIAFTAYGYRMAIRPKSTEDSEDAKSALFPNGKMTQEVK